LLRAQGDVQRSQVVGEVLEATRPGDRHDGLQPPASSPKVMAPIANGLTRTPERPSGRAAEGDVVVERHGVLLIR
jgi:hypothetical protein